MGGLIDGWVSGWVGWSCRWTDSQLEDAPHTIFFRPSLHADRPHRGPPGQSQQRFRLPDSLLPAAGPPHSLPIKPFVGGGRSKGHALAIKQTKTKQIDVTGCLARTTPRGGRNVQKEITIDNSFPRPQREPGRTDRPGRRPPVSRGRPRSIQGAHARFDPKIDS